MIAYIPLLARGILMTVSAWLLAGMIGLTVGTLLGILACPRLYPNFIRCMVRSYTFVVKGVPVYVQILIAYFAVPALLAIQCSGFVAATVALACCSAGYTADIIRAGLNSIDQGQWDAAAVLGYTRWNMLKRIILPQTFRVMLPALAGEYEQLLKSTSLMATIGVMEVTRMGMNIISRELNPFAVYVTIAFIYLCFSALLHIIVYGIERRLGYAQR